jgi:tetratricopeptide (TPR) repeat protein
MVSLAEGYDLRRDDAPPDGWRKVMGMVDDVTAELGGLLEARPARGVWLASVLFEVWKDTGHLEEGLRWTEAALHTQTAPSAELCALLYAKTLLLFWLGRPVPARAAFNEAQALRRLPESDEIRGELLVRAGLAHTCNGDWALSEAAQREAVEVFMAAGREQNAARALNHLALSMLFQGRFREGRELGQRSLELRRRQGKRVEPPLDTVAQACALMGDLDLAQQCWVEACDLVLADADVPGAAYSLRGMVYVCGSRGRREDALRLYYCAEQLAAGGAPYDEPLAAPLKRLVMRLQAGMPREQLARLREEGAALTPVAAMRLAASGPT